MTYSYTYDGVGNITSVRENGVLRAEYYYDSLGQLGQSTYYSDRYYSEGYGDNYEFTYDKSGNITQVVRNYGVGAEFSETKNYTYGNTTWGDLLTNFNGTVIPYDNIGNPSRWRNSSYIEWYGRQLSRLVSTNGTTIGYSYNADGIRTGKYFYDAEGDINGTIKYTLDGSTIVAENRLGTKIYYTYDDKGSIMGMYYGGQNYIFSKNLQGDVIGIYNENRQLVAKYQYNAYGEITAITDASGVDVSSNSAHIANVNPFRYRGYYYDNETGFYYLQSRYYDPVVGRFLNADAYVSTGQGILGNNMFAYCNNNPVMCCDAKGETPALAIPLLEPVFGWFLYGARDALGDFFTGFTSAIGDAIDGVSDWFSEQSRKKAEQKQKRADALEKKAAMQKAKDRINDVPEGQCVFVYLDERKFPIVGTQLYSIQDAAMLTRGAVLAGIPTVKAMEYYNWGIFTPNKLDAERYALFSFGGFIYEENGLSHSPLPHLHAPGHSITIDKETNPHIWYLQ